MHHADLRSSQPTSDDVTRLDPNLRFGAVCNETAMIVEFVQLQFLNSGNRRGRLRALLGSRVRDKKTRSCGRRVINGETGSSASALPLLRCCRSW
jgi:hypothetical protein